METYKYSGKGTMTILRLVRPAVLITRALFCSRISNWSVSVEKRFSGTRTIACLQVKPLPPLDSQSKKAGGKVCKRNSRQPVNLTGCGNSTSQKRQALLGTNKQSAGLAERADSRAYQSRKKDSTGQSRQGAPIWRQESYVSTVQHTQSL